VPKNVVYPRYRVREGVIVEKRRGGKVPLWDRLLVAKTVDEAVEMVNEMNKRDIIETTKVKAREAKKRLLSEKGCCGGKSHSGGGVVASPDLPLNAATSKQGVTMSVTDEQVSLADELSELAGRVFSAAENDDPSEAKAPREKLIAKANELKKELDEMPEAGDVGDEG
jgi:hypothetical protein